MVGRFATLAKQSPPSSSRQPPPPYNHSPLIVAETTTTRTEVVTTTTTTHFFSLPLWRKRGPFSSSSSRKSAVDVHSGTDEHGIGSSSSRSSFYMLEKDLPPTPSEEPGLSASQQPGPSLSSENVSKNQTRRLKPQTPRHLNDGKFSPPKQSAAVLVHAALGVGLTHTLPQAAPPSSSEVNTVAFAQSPSRSCDSPQQPRLRKSRSARKLWDAPSSDRAVSDISADECRRSRVISFSGSALLNLDKSDEKGKYKERKESADLPLSSSSSPTIPQSISRRASFWSRRKLHPQDTPGSPPTERPPTPQKVQLPVFAPISPFNMNITITPSSPSPDLRQRNTHARGLSRSHSAHSSLRPTPLDMDIAPVLVSSKPRDLLETSPSSTTSVSLIPGSIEEPSSIIEDEANTLARRPRAQTNPPLLNRLSLGWLSPSSPSIPSLQRLSNNSPVYPRLHTSSGTLTNASKGRQNSFPLSAESPSSSRSSGLFERGTSAAIPMPTGNEEPLNYLRRLQAAVSKAEIAGILASSPDTFYNQALRTYIGEFNFVDDPLDVALRKLLMEVGLPRETQQIDRVIEAFANRYLQCNPALFTSNDHPYILAFSLIMLHTDAFNKSNKRKMSKADYIKNTRLPGIPPEVLDCFYDNIVFAPFIFIEDPLDINGQRAMPITPGMRMIKVDPYYLITNNLLAPLRIDVRTTIPKDNPYSYEGTGGPWDEARLQQLFAKASRIEVSAATDVVRVSPFFSKGVIGGLASPPGNGGLITPTTAPASMGGMWTLKLTKVGLLNRKDDVLEGGKKAGNRKWKPWSTVLTGSQLLFFRDPSWATSLLPLSSEGHNLFPQSALFKPDEVLSLRGAIAVYDEVYTRYDNTFRLLLSDSRQLLLQASDEKELNEWIAGINYASAFKTAGVRIRPLEMSRTDVKLTGVAAATSHLHDLQTHTAKRHIWNGDAPHDLMGMLSDDPELVVQRPALKRRLTIVTNTADMDFEVPTAPEVDGAEQFKATFDQVKADLAAGLSVPRDDGEFSKLSIDPNPWLYPPSATSPHSDSPHLPSRMSIVQSKVDDLELRITAAQSQLDAKMRFVRNIAILTPFQKSTRDRLGIAVQHVAQRIIQVRLEITRLICHRDILANDIESEGRSWYKAKTIALQAATETLQSRRNVVPRMTLSQPASDPVDIHLTPESPLTSHAFDPSLSRLSVSSICESWHSAIDFGPDWPASEDPSSSFLGPGHLFDSPPSSNTPSVQSHSAYDGNAEAQIRDSSLPLSFQPHAESPRSSGDFLSHENFYEASAPDEQAEEWNQTRCAQRVSLVRLPSDIQLKPRHARPGKLSGDLRRSS
ncbi:hypothetical protein C0991_000051 [Blastosporella zonata]|nr:hypothetical protein C0991_000051 [Blastosporella zonata]